jgi:hypothetical protein
MQRAGTSKSKKDRGRARQGHGAGTRHLGDRPAGLAPRPPSTHTYCYKIFN